jgi:hypothetical protein
LSLFGDDHDAFHLPFLRTDVRSSHNNTLPSGTTGIIFFTSTSLNEAVTYTARFCNNYGHIEIKNLRQLPFNVTVADLYHLYPREQGSNNKS